MKPIKSILSVKNKINKWIFGCMTTVTTMVATAVPVSATDGTTGNADTQFISTILKNFYTAISGNITLLAAVSISICIVMIMFGSSGKSAESSMRGLKIIAFAWIGFSVLGAIVKYGDKLLAPYGFGKVYGV